MHGRSRRSGGVWRVGLGIALLSAVAACGKKGNPLPPLRVIPNATTDLAVAQRGNQVVCG